MINYEVQRYLRSSLVVYVTAVGSTVTIRVFRIIRYVLYLTIAYYKKFMDRARVASGILRSRNVIRRNNKPFQA